MRFTLFYSYLCSQLKTFIMKYIRHTPTLKDITIWFAVLALLFVIPVLSSSLLEPESPGLMIIPLIILAFFIFNLAIRRSLYFKNYFTSRYNLLTSKMRSEKTFDISKPLMFEKIIEVIENSTFKLVEADRAHFEILAITKITYKSWGENLYISFATNGDETTIKFCSVTLFQITSWGKNQKNYNDFLNEIESSLTI